MVNGVILVAWSQKVLERQIDYGAKLGHVVLSLAKMELSNFYKNVMPVADYFDQRGMLISVGLRGAARAAAIPTFGDAFCRFQINGERNPADVYKDFRSAVLRILGSAEQVGPPAPITDIGSTATVLPRAPSSEYKPPTKGYPPVIWVISEYSGHERPGQTFSR